MARQVECSGDKILLSRHPPQAVVGGSVPDLRGAGKSYAYFFRRVTVKCARKVEAIGAANPEMSVLKPLGKRVGAQLPPTSA
jgi:hypothetical protein